MAAKTRRRAGLPSPLGAASRLSCVTSDLSSLTHSPPATYPNRRRRPRLLLCYPLGREAMAAKRQIAASRRNAAKSTGPRAAEGKPASNGFVLPPAPAAQRAPPGRAIESIPMKIKAPFVPPAEISAPWNGFVSHFHATECLAAAHRGPQTPRCPPKPPLRRFARPRTALQYGRII